MQKHEMAEMPSSPLTPQRGLTPSDGPTSPLVEAMAAANPLNTEAALKASLPVSLASMMTSSAKTRATYPEGEDVKIQFLGYEPIPSDVPAPLLCQALEAVKLSLSPMDERYIATLVTRMKAMTRSRSESSVDAVVQIKIYAEELTAWPADVVKYIVTTWHQRSDFFPTMHELEIELRRWSERRKAFCEVLQVAVDKHPNIVQ